MATLNHDLIRKLLDKGDFGELFRARLGWDNPPDHLGQGVPLPKEDGVNGIGGASLIARAVAEKRGVLVWVIGCFEIPSRAVQHRANRELRRWSTDRLVVFDAGDEQLWLWPEQRPSGTGWRLVDHSYRRGEGNDALLQRLERVKFYVKETRTLTGPKVLDRVRQSFNVEKVTKRFYIQFKEHHEALTDRIEGIPQNKARDRRWYASVLLNRLMFIYFIQRRGFLNDDSDYLRTSLVEVRQHFGEDRFYAYYRDFLLPLFHHGLGAPPDARVWEDPRIEGIIGEVPYVDGGIFEEHRLEQDYEIQIPDSAFQSLFDFFDQWRWHLDECPSGAHNEINPDILGFIFEQYVNYTESGRREKGAYYTKPDVTGYMSTYTITPAVVDRLLEAGLEDPCVLLSGSGDRYLHTSLGYGRNVEMPEGDLPPGEFPKESLDIALPGERWCDVTHRRARYRELVDLVDGGGVANIDDAITANLDVAGLMEDYFDLLATPEECQAAFDALRSLTVCDPTCGSGAFLLSALDVLEPMYATVYDRATEVSLSLSRRTITKKR